MLQWLVAVDFDVDLDRVKVFLRAKMERWRAAIDERFERATQDAEAIIAEIARVVRSRRIYQWGSLLDRRRFTEISDIDIALEGLTGAEAFFAAPLGVAMEHTRLRVDVVELEKLPATISQRIRERGKLEYDWDRLDFLLIKLRKAHPIASGDLDRFVAFLEATLE